MRTWRFITADVAVDGCVITSTFRDGLVNRFDLRWALSRDYRYAVRRYGYGDDWQSYGVQHDLTHHWLADRLWWPWSWAIHDGDGEQRLDEAPQHIQDEEHLVNHLQAYVRTGENLDSFGFVAWCFPELDAVAAELRELYDRAASTWPKSGPST